MTDYYTLDGHTPVPCDLLTWGRMFEDAEGRTVAQDSIGEFRVSTVFLGMNHSFGDGPPLLFETMIFGGRYDDDEYQTRCTTWEEAEEMHKVACAACSQSTAPTPPSEDGSP